MTTKPYTLPEKVETLHFDGDLTGLEVRVRVRPVPLGTYLEVVSILEERRMAAGMTRLAAIFSEVALVGWNLPGKPSPEAMLELDFNVALGIVTAWVSLVGDVPLPLPVASGSTSM